MLVFFFKQKTAYEMRISDWSSDVCSSDLDGVGGAAPGAVDAVDPRPDRARPVLHPAGAQHRDHVVDAEDHADVGHGPDAAEDDADHDADLRRRTEERRVGHECVSTWRSRWSQYHLKHKKKQTKRHSRT